MTSNNSEKFGGLSKPRVAIEEISFFINDSGLVEVAGRGRKFSWGNGQKGRNRI